MKRSIVLSALLAAAACAAGAAWWLTRSEPAPRAIEALGIADTRGTEVRPPLESKAAAVEPAPLRASARVERAEELLQDAILLEGRIAFPAGTPTDEAAWIEATGERFADSEQGRVHRAPVAPDGRFCAAFAPGTVRGELVLDARYLFLAEAIQVDLASQRGPLVLEPALGGRIEGRFIPPRLAPNERVDFELLLVRLTAHSADLAFRRVVDVDAQGCFEFRGVPAGDAFVLEVESRAWLRRPRSISVRAGATSEIELALERGVRLSGRAVGLGGVELGGAVALRFATRAARGGAVLAQTSCRSTRDGRFEIAGMAPGWIELEASRQGFLDFALELGSLGDGEVHDELDLRLDPGRVVSGRVLWPDGRPAAGARVALVPSEGDGGALLHYTDGDGRFRFGGLVDESFVLDARATPARTPECREPWPWAARCDAAWAGAELAPLVLEPGEVLRVRALDDAGAPVERYHVLAQPEPTRGRFDERVLRSVASPSGEGELRGLHGGAWHVRAWTHDHVDPASERVVPPFAGSELVLRLARAARLSGRVVNPAGEAIGAARVTLVASGSSPDSTPKTSTVNADEEGFFAIPCAPPGACTLVARAEGYAPSAPLALTLAPASKTSGLVLALRQPARLTGEIDPSAARVAGRKVYVSPRLGGLTKELTSDAGGRFEVEGLTPGSYTVLLLPLEPTSTAVVGCLSDRKEVEVREGEIAHVVLCAPPERPIRVHGRVTDAGRSLAGAQIVWGTLLSGRSVAALCDANGEYELALHEAGDYVVSVALPDGAPTHVVAAISDAESQRFDVSLPIASAFGTARGPAEPTSR